jgi:hypothetical protein
VRIFLAVKRWAQAKDRPPLEGVGAVLTLGALLVSTAYLAIPRAAEPTLLPLPQPDRRVLARQRAEETRLSEAARRVPLSFEVRAVGDAFRRLGAGTVAEQGVPESTLRDLQKLAAEAQVKAGGRALLALRSVQAELFVAAAREWDTTGKMSTELRELGGDFPEVAEQRGFRKAGRLVLAAPGPRRRRTRRRRPRARCRAPPRRRRPAARRGGGRCSTGRRGPGSR